MLLPAPPMKLRKRSNSKAKLARVAPVGPLTLVAAVYDQDGPIVTLTFDRAVDVSGFDGAQVTVNDPLSLSSLFDGAGGATVVSPGVVQVTLAPAGLPSGDVVTMSASGATGIVAVGDGATWAGVSDLALPFP